VLELQDLDATILLDIRYARKDNFIGRPVYAEARAFLQPVAAFAVAEVHRSLKAEGFGIVIYDGYRPWSVTKMFWETVPPEHRKFVANPETGSVHNRGCAVDLSLYDLASGDQILMPSGYDEFNERAYPSYEGGTDEERRNRDVLIATMESNGFAVNPNEWWHFDHKDWENYPILDLPFSSL
jgi:D-alanyl-D-alanine dipeptidase